MKLELRVPTAVHYTWFWKFDRNKTKAYPGKQLLPLSAVRGQLTLSASYPRHSADQLVELVTVPGCRATHHTLLLNGQLEATLEHLNPLHPAQTYDKIS